MTDKEKDKQFLKSLTEKYGNEAIYAILNEYSYGYYGNGLDSPGPSPKYNGVPGFFKSLPSFLLCSIVSPPLAGIMLLGALVLRLREKWHSKESAISMLNPFTWAEYLATGNYVPKGMTKPFWSAGSNADPEVLKKAQFDASAGNISDVYKELYSKMSPEEMSQLIFNYHWIHFDNGEIRKVRCATTREMEVFAKAFMNKKVARLDYEKMNTLLKTNKNCSVYICEFDDGQLMYVVADSEKGAKDVATDYIINKIGKEIKKNDPDFELPELKYVKKTNADRVPPMTRLLSDKQPRQMPTHTDDNPLKQYENVISNKYFWEIDNFVQYKITAKDGFNGLVFNMPAEPDKENNQIKGLVNEFFKSKELKGCLSEYAEKVKKGVEGNSGLIWYKVTSTDKDSYIIPAKDEAEALELGNKINTAKIYVINNILNQQQQNEVYKKLGKLNVSQIGHNDRGEHQIIKIIENAIKNKDKDEIKISIARCYSKEDSTMDIDKGNFSYTLK